MHSDEFDPNGMIECVQEAGDVLVVPSLVSHATLNLEESVGVAYEFSFEAEKSWSSLERATESGKAAGPPFGSDSLTHSRMRVPGSGHYEWHAPHWHDLDASDDT